MHLSILRFLFSMVILIPNRQLHFRSLRFSGFCFVLFYFCFENEAMNKRHNENSDLNIYSTISIRLAIKIISSADRMPGWLSDWVSECTANESSTKWKTDFSRLVKSHIGFFLLIGVWIALARGQCCFRRKKQKDFRRTKWSGMKRAAKQKVVVVADFNV